MPCRQPGDNDSDRWYDVERERERDKREGADECEHQMDARCRVLFSKIESGQNRETGGQIGSMALPHLARRRLILLVVVTLTSHSLDCVASL